MFLFAISAKIRLGVFSQRVRDKLKVLKPKAEMLYPELWKSLLMAGYICFSLLYKFFVFLFFIYQDCE